MNGIGAANVPPHKNRAAIHGGPKLLEVLHTAPSIRRCSDTEALNQGMNWVTVLPSLPSLPHDAADREQFSSSGADNGVERFSVRHRRRFLVLLAFQQQRRPCPEIRTSSYRQTT
jgi:hypothetical protein